jgi:hypothetical protein
VEDRGLAEERAPNTTPFPPLSPDLPPKRGNLELVGVRVQAAETRLGARIARPSRPQERAGPVRTQRRRFQHAVTDMIRIVLHLSGVPMALDRPGHAADETGVAAADQHRPHADATVRRAVPAEPRTRAEYCAAVRGPDDRTIRPDEDHRTGAERPERSGWDTVDAENRPSLDSIRITPERSTHILDGEPDDGGGHRHGTGKPGKTEFPASWSDETILDKVLDAAQRPDSAPVYQHWNDRWLCVGTRDSVEVSVIVLCSGEVWTAWPEEGGPGVVRNPKKGTS